MHTNQQHTDAFLNSLAKMERAKAPDFFQTRLMARLEKEELPKNVFVWQQVLKPVPVLALLGCLVILNLYTLGDIFLHKNISAQKEETGMSGFINEYNLNSSVDINN
ncbi:MAG: hypothetical protein ACOYVG_00475 [Bacteroidota bacterium]